MSLLDAFSRYRGLTDEQRVLVHGRGADTRPLHAWRSLLEEVVAYEAVRVRGAKHARWVAITLAVVTVALIGMALRPPLSLESARPWLWASGVSGVLLAVAVDVLFVLRRRAVERHLSRTTLPFVRSLEEELGPEMPLYLSLRLDGLKPTREQDVRWLEGAAQLPDGSLLHFGGRDVEEPSGTRTWLRATWSQTHHDVHTHVLGQDDPTVSGLTRTVADEARREGNPFTSMEMVALREAHGVQVQLLRLEAFEEQRVPPPPVGDVRGEASRGITGGRSHDDVKADVLMELARAARSPSSA